MIKSTFDGYVTLHKSKYPSATNLLWAFLNSYLKIANLPIPDNFGTDPYSLVVPAVDAKWINARSKLTDLPLLSPGTSVSVCIPGLSRTVQSYGWNRTFNGSKACSFMSFSLPTLLVMSVSSFLLFSTSIFLLLSFFSSHFFFVRVIVSAVVSFVMPVIRLIFSVASISCNIIVFDLLIQVLDILDRKLIG